MIYIVIFLKLYADHNAVRIMLDIRSSLNIYVIAPLAISQRQTSLFKISKLGMGKVGLMHEY